MKIRSGRDKKGAWKIQKNEHYEEIENKTGGRNRM